MIPVQFRPKYSIEQYVVTFQFPAGLTGEVTVSSEVETGAAGLLVGPFFRFQETVSVVVAGGAPGSIYKIFCSLGDFEFMGRLAVKESAAVVPAGASVAPFTQVVTTPPYPTYVEDRFGALFNIRNVISMQMLYDELGTEMGMLDAQRRLVKQEYENYPPDELDVGMNMLDATRKSVLLQYTNYPPEAVGIGMAMRDATRKDVMIRYFNYQPEEFDVSMAMRDATRTPV